MIENSSATPTLSEFQTRGHYVQCQYLPTSS